MALPSLWTNRPTVHFIFVIVNKGLTWKCVGQKKSVTIVKQKKQNNLTKEKKKTPKQHKLKKKKLLETEIKQKSNTEMNKITI